MTIDDQKAADAIIAFVDALRADGERNARLELVLEDGRLVALRKVHIGKWAQLKAGN